MTSTDESDTTGESSDEYPAESAAKRLLRGDRRYRRHHRHRRKREREPDDEDGPPNDRDAGASTKDVLLRGSDP